MRASRYVPSYCHLKYTGLLEDNKREPNFTSHEFSFCSRMLVLYLKVFVIKQKIVIF